jgi:Ca-activated chloride channel family protein
VSSIDALKYQEQNVKPSAKNSDELLTLKLRYKNPKGSKSKLIEQPLMDRTLRLDKSSDNFRFAAAVAGFGMLLRDSNTKET